MRECHSSPFEVGAGDVERRFESFVYRERADEMRLGGRVAAAAGVGQAEVGR